MVNYLPAPLDEFLNGHVHTQLVDNRTYKLNVVYRVLAASLYAVETGIGFGPSADFQIAGQRLTR
jgi:hypothetical protein